MRYQDGFHLSNLFLRNNKHVHTVAKDGNVKRYIWCADRLLWEHDMRPQSLTRVITKQIMELVANGLANKQITQKLADKTNNTLWKADIKNILRYTAVPTDPEFMRNLDKLDATIPIANGFKINILTKIKSKRNHRDWYTYELQSTYLPSLKRDNNRFDHFVKSIFDDGEEYQFIRLLAGKFVLPDQHENILVIWQHLIGGGGKTIFVKSILEALERRVIGLDRSVILSSTKNAGFEIAKLRGKTIGFIDEITTDEDEKRDVPLDLARLQDLTGGGIRAELDKYEKANGKQAQAQTASIMTLGNGSFFNKGNKSKAIDRRVIFFTTPTFFRATTDEDYDALNEHCKVKDPNIWATLIEHRNHIFTWLVNAAHDYLQRKRREPTFSLVDAQPQRFKDEWNALSETSTEFEQEQFENFIYSECQNTEDNLILLSKFIEKLTEHVSKDYNSEQFTYTQYKVKKMFKNMANVANVMPCVIRPHRVNNNGKRPYYVKHLAIQDE